MSTDYSGIFVRGIKIPEDVLKRSEDETTNGNEYSDLENKLDEFDNVNIIWIMGYEDNFIKEEIYLYVDSCEADYPGVVIEIDLPKLSVKVVNQLKAACKKLGMNYTPPKLYVGSSVC